MGDSETAMAGVRRVQDGLRALGVGDEAGLLAAVNGATDAEARWMAASLFSVMRMTMTVFAKGDEAKARRLLLAGADGLDQDAAVTGAEVVIEEAFRREGLS